MTPIGWGHFCPQGHNWQDLCRAHVIAAYQIYIVQALDLVVSEKIFSSPEQKAHKVS